MNSEDSNWLTSLLDVNNSGIADIGIGGFALILTLSLVSSWLISALYLHFYGSRATGSQIHRAFPLLGISITTIFICIQFSLPLSLGLLGALSIVRFRTPIKEPEEIGFIMLVIGASIATATFSITFLAILLIFAFITLYFQQKGFKALNRITEDGILLITLPSENYQGQAEQLKALLQDLLIKPKLQSVSKSQENTVISYSFSGVKSEDAVNVQTKVADILNPVDINIYMNKTATL